MFLSIITRHHPDRPKSLAVNIGSLAAQTCKDFEHLVFPDHLRRGMAGAQRWLIELVPRAAGRFVMVLNDDDYMENRDGVEILKAFDNPDIPGIICRRDCGNLGVLPHSPAHFQYACPRSGGIDASCYILRRDIYCRSVGVYSSGAYDADHTCIADVWEKAHKEKILHMFGYTDAILCAVQKGALNGAGEPS